MRKFFGFRSSSSADSSPVHPPDDEKAISKCHHKEDAPNPKLARSHSFSLAREAKPGHDPWGLPNSPLTGSSGNSRTSARHMRSKSGNLSAVRPSYEVDMLDSPTSPKEYQSSSGNSSHRSPVSLKCRADRITKILNKEKILDLYMYGENQETEARKGSQKYSSDVGDNGFLMDSRIPSNKGRPPRAQSTAPSSPTCKMGNGRISSFRELDTSHHLSAQEWTRNDLWPSSPRLHTRRYSEKLLHELPQKARMKSRDSDSATTVATEDIYEDSSNTRPISNSNAISKKHFNDLIPPYDNISGYSYEEPLTFQRSSYDHGLAGLKDHSSSSSEPQESNTDEELYEKQKEVEHMLALLSEEDLEVDELINSSPNGLTLLQKIRNIAEDRKHLALELASQIKFRKTERSASKERLKAAKMELDIRTRRLEKEKNEMQSTLEKELDRRSSSWSLKLEKFQSEEQRLRERVRELAEKNVSLQREISVLKGNEVDTRSRIVNSETQLNNTTASLKEVQTENHDLRQALSDLQERFKGTEEECDCIRISYKQKEKEAKELQKVVVRLQRTCSEQDHTINGLRQGYSNEIGKLSVDRDDNLSKLQMEQLRLTGVEQMLRKEVESFRKEMDSLKHENLCVLNRLRGNGNGYVSSFRLDKELRARVDCLQTQGLLLLNDNVYFCGELLGFMKHRNHEYDQEANNDSSRYSIPECTVKYQNLRRRVENYRRSLQTTLKILEEKNTSEASEGEPCTTEGAVPMPSRSQAPEDAMEFELKAETLLTKLLQEKLCSKELELEQLQSDLASFVRANDVLQTETQRLQDELSCLTHKANDMTLQMLRKDESINQLENDLQECTKELAATRSLVTKVSGERDHLWEQVKSSRERIMLLELEASSNKKTIETLDEDIHVKDGQITILEESLRNKPYCIVCSSNSSDRFAVR